jgi:hypothetical protein
VRMQSARYLFGVAVRHHHRYPEDMIERDGGVMKRFADPPNSYYLLANCAIGS